jgi:hypothetical protein
MRLTTPALLLAAVGAFGGQAGAPAAADGVFSNRFDDGDISDWTVTTTKYAVFETSRAECVSAPYSVHMQSTGDGKATGVSPSYTLELSRKSSRCRATVSAVMKWRPLWLTSLRVSTPSSSAGTITKQRANAVTVEDVVIS